MSLHKRHGEALSRHSDMPAAWVYTPDRGLDDERRLGLSAVVSLAVGQQQPGPRGDVPERECG